MKQIIEKGTKKIITCEHCGCKFSFEKEDIYFPYIGSNGYVNCPQCEEPIITKRIGLF